MGFIVSKGQGQVKWGHQMEMLHVCRATHVLWVICNEEYDGGIYF